MSGKLEKGRFAEARAQLKADLELYLTLQSASDDDVENRAALIEVAWDAVQKSAASYAAAGAELGYGPEQLRPARAAGLSARPRASSDGMSTEDLMKLVAEDEK